jgi:hypothetical protein
MSLCFGLIACTQNNQAADIPAASESAIKDIPSEDLPIDITNISYDNTIDWASMEYVYAPYSFEMPEDWQTVDGTEYGLINGVFLIPPDTSMDHFPFSANVALEVIGSMPGGEEALDFSSESVQKEFFAAQIVSTYSKMGGLSDLKFLVWESKQGYVYIANFKRANEQLTMYQTTYYIMNPDVTIVVNASHFGEDAVPEVNGVARHLINTFA